MMLARRSLLEWCAALGISGPGMPRPRSGQQHVAEPVSTPLWPGAPPGAPDPLPIERIVDQGGLPNGPNRYVEGVAHPLLLQFLPERQTSSGAVLLMPGGSYMREVIDREGLETARMLNAQGIAAFILRYRLPIDGWRDRSFAPLQDAQRAMRLIRARAPSIGIDPERIAVLGFSAGGHLAALLASLHMRSTYRPVDGADALSARPALTGLLYPVIDMNPPLVHAKSRDALLGPNATAAACAEFSAQRLVTSATPPAILFHAADDPGVPMGNSLAMFEALRAAKVAAEMHIFESGGHGFGIQGAQGKPAAAWPELFLAFARAHAVI